MYIQMRSLATPAPAPAALLCSRLRYANHFLKHFAVVKPKREEIANAKWGQGKRDGHGTTSCSSSLFLSLVLAESIRAIWNACGGVDVDVNGFCSFAAKLRVWSFVLVLHILHLCAYKQTYKHVCVVKRKSFCFCFPCSRWSRHCDQSGKICYMRFYRTSSLYSLPFVEGEPPVRLSVCVRECVYTCVLFI